MNWYYAAAGRQTGPVDDATLDELVRAGTVQPETLVWREGMSGWQPLRNARPPAAPQGMPEAPPGLMFCAECGRPFAPSEMVTIGESAVCAACKPVFLQKVREGGQVAGARRYGGFWIRVAAKIIDGVILSIANLVFLIFLPALAVSPDPGVALGFIVLMQLGSLVVSMCYEMYFVGSRGATPGKLILNLKIIRGDGGRVSYGLAAGRYFASLISGFTLGIGYIMAAFDDQKRTLHDRICDTRVIYQS